MVIGAYYRTSLESPHHPEHDPSSFCRDAGNKEFLGAPGSSVLGLEVVCCASIRAASALCLASCSLRSAWPAAPAAAAASAPDSHISGKRTVASTSDFSVATSWRHYSCPLSEASARSAGFTDRSARRSIHCARIGFIANTCLRVIVAASSSASARTSARWIAGDLKYFS